MTEKAKSRSVHKVGTHREYRLAMTEIRAIDKLAVGHGSVGDLRRRRLQAMCDKWEDRILVEEMGAKLTPRKR